MAHDKTMFCVANPCGYFQEEVSWNTMASLPMKLGWNNTSATQLARMLLDRDVDYEERLIFCTVRMVTCPRWHLSPWSCVRHSTPRIHHDLRLVSRRRPASDCDGKTPPSPVSVATRELSDREAEDIQKSLASQRGEKQDDQKMPGNRRSWTGEPKKNRNFCVPTTGSLAHSLRHREWPQSAKWPITMKSRTTPLSAVEVKEWTRSAKGYSVRPLETNGNEYD